jgi:hypothetical protein
MKRIEIECPYCGRSHVHNIEGVMDIGESRPEEERVDNEPSELPVDDSD